MITPSIRRGHEVSVPSAVEKVDIVGLALRVRQFLSQLGTVPVIDIPGSHNARDFGYLLIDTPHQYRITRE